MLHRALQQFLADVFWGDLDVLLMDLPPGTGDIAISVAQLVPSAELLVVTTPQLAAREVAERAGSIALQTHQQIVGVVENMSWLELPDGTRMELFGSGGGQAVADSLAAADRHPGAAARPDPDRSAGARGRRRRRAGRARPRRSRRPRWRCSAVADALAARQHSLVGRSLGPHGAGRSLSQRSAPGPSSRQTASGGVGVERSRSPRPSGRLRPDGPAIAA